MASIRRRGNGYRAEVCVNRVRDAATFDTRPEAQAWALRREAELRDGKVDVAPPRTPVSSLFARYSTEVSEDKRGARWEKIRLAAMSDMPIGRLPVRDLTRADIEDYIRYRDKDVKAGTIRRELNLLSHVFNYGVKNGWLDINPVKGVERPKKPAARTRIATDVEIGLMVWAFGIEGDPKPTRIKHRVGYAWLFALETAMRAGEIRSLGPESINDRVAHLPKTKIDEPRNVPLSKRAMEILELVGYHFDLTAEQIDANFRKYRDEAGIKNMTFHDSRHTAITRLAKQFARKGLSPMDLARMTGHKNLAQLMEYFNPDPTEIAGMLD